MVCRGFFFDLIVVRIDVPGVQIDNNKLIFVSATFNRTKLRITPSRINVVEFKENRSYEFEIPPRQLRKDLEENPLEITVFYDLRPIGIANIPWPSKVLNKINQNMGEVTHIGDTVLFCCMDLSNPVGVMEYVYRFQCKCEESSDDCEPRPKCDLKKCIAKNINPEDVLFLVAEPEQQDDCLDVFSSMNLHAAYDDGYDLTPYRFWHGKTIKGGGAVNTCYMRTFDPQDVKGSKGTRRAMNRCRRTEGYATSSRCQNSGGCRQASSLPANLNCRGVHDARLARACMGCLPQRSGCGTLNSSKKFGGCFSTNYCRQLQNQSSGKKCPSNEKSVIKIMEPCSSTKGFKKGKIYLLCGPPTVDAYKSECDIKAMKDQFFLMPCSSRCDRSKAMETSKTSALNLSNKSSANLESSPKKKPRKLHCDTELIKEFKRSQREKTKKILESCRGTQGKTDMPLANFESQKLENNIVVNMTADEIMREFLKDDASNSEKKSL